MSISKQSYYVSTDELVDISKESPLTYIQWLQYENSFSKTDAFEEYNIYLTHWYKSKGVTSLSTQSQYIRNIYIELLKQITLDYSTAEEQRVLSNIDYTNDLDLDIALPFFAKKLKQIALYYSEKRDEIKHVPTKVNLKGSNYGLSKLIISEITDILKNDTKAKEQLAAADLTLQQVLTNLDVKVIELYDTEQNYYNIPNNYDRQEYTNIETQRYNYFNMSIVPDSTKLFLSDTFATAVKDLILDVPVNLQITSDEILNNSDNIALAITDIVTGTELDRLNVNSFDNYLSTGELNINYEQLAFKKYAGTDYYYLSTGDTLTETTSGQLFKAEAPHRNLINKYRPTILISPGENLYREEFLGGFFKIEEIGLINYTTLEHTYTIEPVENSIQYFPDPSSGAKGYYGSYELNNPNITYYENINWQKSRVTNHHSYGQQSQYTNIIRYTPYQSSSETQATPNQGVFRYNDSYNFWTTDKSSNWTQADVFPKDDTGIQPLVSRQETLVTGKQNIYTWKTDIYGNEFALVKKGIDPEDETFVNKNNTVYDTEYITSDTTSVGGHKNKVTNKTHSSKNLTEQTSLSGTLYTRLNSNTGVQQLTSASISGLYSKYKVDGSVAIGTTSVTLSSISQDIENNLLDIDVIYDTIIFDTENYIVFEKISYNYETSIITSGQSGFAFILKDQYNNKYEKTSNWWFDEEANRILITKTTVHESLSSTTSRMVYPEIYIYKLNTQTLEKAYPDPDLTAEQLIYETSQFSLSSLYQSIDSLYDMTDVSLPKLTYNKESQRFQTVQLAKDPAENMFLLKNDFRMYDNTIEYIRSDLYRNKYLTYTVNPYNSEIESAYFNETNTNITGDTWYHDKNNNIIYMSAVETTGSPIPVENSSCAWTYGNNYFNYTGERDIVITFDFAMTGTTLNPSFSANGLSVLFYKARKVENIKKYKGGIPAENYELLDDGGLGPAFTYFPDLSGTNTNPSLSGLDSAHAAVILDNIGNVAGDTTRPGNSVTTQGPFLSRDTYSNTVSLSGTGFNLWQPVPATNHSDLKFTRCKVVLTNLGREIRVYMKTLPEGEFEHISTTDISAFFPGGYDIPKRMKLSLASNTSTNPGIIAIRNITITGDSNLDDSLIITV